MLCYVTAFLDLNRDHWDFFRRSQEEYFRHFSPLLDIFEKDGNRSEYSLIVYIDSKHEENLRKIIPSCLEGIIHVVCIDEKFMEENIPVWSRLNKEREIMESEEYKTRFASRLCFPENSNPKYTLINHAKIDFVSHATFIFPVCEYFCWVDFGYFQNRDRIPSSLLDINLFDKDKINYTLINPLDERDTDVEYTMHCAPERIGGFFFFGNRENVLIYQKLYHEVHIQFQENNLADDDQHLALRCYFRNPSLFSLHNLGGWHKALTSFQKSTDLWLV